MRRSNWATFAVVQPQVGEREKRLGLVQEPEHHPLAEGRGDDGDADVHALVADLHLDAAVLREALLGDVELGHDLDARDQRRLDAPRQVQQVVEHAVDPVADLQRVGIGLDVDVARAVLDGLGEDQVDELDDGRVARFVQQVGRLLDLGDDAVGRLAVHDLG